VIILPAHNSNEYNDEGANIAVIYVNTTQIAKRIDVVVRLRKADKSLAKMCYWDNQVLFYHLTEDQIRKLAGKADRVIEDQLFFRKPDDIMEEYGDPIRIDCEQMVVWDYCVSWAAYDHYCSDRMESEQIHIDTLRTLTDKRKK